MTNATNNKEIIKRAVLSFNKPFNATNLILRLQTFYDATQFTRNLINETIDELCEAELIRYIEIEENIWGYEVIKKDANNVSDDTFNAHAISKLSKDKIKEIALSFTRPFSAIDIIVEVQKNTENKLTTEDRSLIRVTMKELIESGDVTMHEVTMDGGEFTIQVYETTSRRIRKMAEDVALLQGISIEPQMPIAIGFETGCRNTANLPKPGGFRVKYKCPECDEELSRWLGVKEKHCHNCGQKIDWNVVLYLNSTQSDNIMNAEDKKQTIEEYLALVNKLNIEKEFTEPVFIAEEGEK